MSYQPTRAWNDFPDRVHTLRWPLIAWLEAILDRPVTNYSGSDSVKYPPAQDSRYKLLPFDDTASSPVQGRGEGVLICVDLESCERAIREAGGIPPGVWIGEPLEVRVGSGSHVYRAAVFSANDDWARRIATLRDLAIMIRRVERNRH